MTYTHHVGQIGVHELQILKLKLNLSALGVEYMVCNQRG